MVSYWLDAKEIEKKQIETITMQIIILKPILLYI